MPDRLEIRLLASVTSAVVKQTSKKELKKKQTVMFVVIRAPFAVTSLKKRCESGEKCNQIQASHLYSYKRVRPTRGCARQSVRGSVGKAFVEVMFPMRNAHRSHNKQAISSAMQRSVRSFVGWSVMHKVP